MREKSCLPLSRKYITLPGEKVQHCLIVSICKSGYKLHHQIIGINYSWLKYVAISPDQSSKSWVIFCDWEVSYLSSSFTLFNAFSLLCHHVRSPFVSRSWRQTLWCTHRGTVVSDRHDPRMWHRKPPNPLLGAHTPTDLHCHHGNCPHASRAECCRHRACGLWKLHGNAAGSDDEEEGRGGPAVGS